MFVCVCVCLTFAFVSFLYLDPKLPPKVKPQSFLPFKEAIVFTVGGGSYFEYHNIQEYSKVRLTSHSPHIAQYRTTL